MLQEEIQDRDLVLQLQISENYKGLDKFLEITYDRETNKLFAIIHASKQRNSLREFMIVSKELY